MCFRKQITFLFAFVLAIQVSNAQITGSQYLAIQGGIMDFSTKWLNNPQPHNSRFSALSQIEYGLSVRKHLNLYSNMSLGHLKNMGVDFEKEMGADFFRWGLGLMLNSKNSFLSFRNQTLIEPYGFFGYNFDIINKNPIVGFRKTVGSVNFGLGFSTPIIPNKLKLEYRYSLNQKLGQDYRTFNQHTFGLQVEINAFHKIGD